MLRDGGMIILIVIVGICIVGGIISTRYLGHDNPIEEFAERVIEEETGVKADLSPSTPE
jgi:hypothetical protein